LERQQESLHLGRLAKCPASIDAAIVTAATIAALTSSNRHQDFQPVKARAEDTAVAPDHDHASSGVIDARTPQRAPDVESGKCRLAARYAILGHELGTRSKYLGPIEREGESS